MFDEWLLRAFLQLWSWLEFLRKPCAANRATLSFSPEKQRRRNWEINNTLLGKQQIFLKDFDRLALKECSSKHFFLAPVSHCCDKALWRDGQYMLLSHEPFGIQSIPLPKYNAKKTMILHIIYKLRMSQNCHRFLLKQRAMQNVKKNTKPAGEDMSYS